MATPAVASSGSALDRAFVESYDGPLCIEPRYERLVRAVLGTQTLEGIDFRYPETAERRRRRSPKLGLASI